MSARTQQQPRIRNRIIPVGHHVCRLQFAGQTPLLMSSGEVDRQDETYLSFRQLSRSRGKSLEDEGRLRELEWHLRLYFDDDLGPYIPGRNIKELLRSAATKYRKGEDVRRSLVVAAYRVPLIYDGPRTVKGLWEAGTFAYTAMVANAGAGSGRVERTRPCFDSWALDCEIAFDPEDLDFTDVEEFVRRSQKYGLGDYRPEFGAFTASVEPLRVQEDPALANGSKPRDGRMEDAVHSHVERITT